MLAEDFYCFSQIFLFYKNERYTHSGSLFCIGTVDLLLHSVKNNPKKPYNELQILPCMHRQRTKYSLCQKALQYITKTLLYLDTNNEKIKSQSPHMEFSKEEFKDY